MGSPFLSNLPNLLRMQNIFGPMSQGARPMDEVPRPNVSGPSASPIAPTAPAPDINTRMSQIYQPSHTASDAYEALASQYPEHPKHSVLSKIGASVIGAGYGPQAGINALEQPHQMAIQSWKDKMGPALSSANLERQENVNSRTLAYQTIAAQLRDEAQKHKEEQDEVNNRIKQQRADVYEFKARNPDFKFDFSGPTIKAINPQTGEIKDTGYDTGNMSDADKLALQHENKLGEIEKAGGEARKTEGVRQEGRETLATQKGWTTANIPDPDDPSRLIGVRVNNDTGEVKRIELDKKPVGPIQKPSGQGSAAKPELPTQTRVRMLNKAREVARNNPEWSKYIKFNGNDFELTKPGGWGGPDKATYDSINAAINGSDSGVKTIEKEIPGSGGKMAVSTDGGKTWKAK